MRSKAENRFKFIPGKTWLVNLILLLNDLIGFLVSIGLVTLFRVWFLPIKDNTPFDPQVIRTIITLISFSILIFAIKGLYPGRGRISVIEMKQIFESVVIAYAIVGVMIFIQGKNESYSRSIFLLNSIFSVLIISAGRFLVRNLITKFLWWGEPIVIIGLQSEISRVINKLQTCPRLGLRPSVALALDIKDPTEIANVPVLPWSIGLQKEVRALNINTNIL